ncbi:hypothetical protein BT96DRAFT_1018424, partial [Gymnopus androsaceus JB14]
MDADSLLPRHWDSRKVRKAYSNWIEFARPNWDEQIDSNSIKLSFESNDASPNAWEGGWDADGSPLFSILEPNPGYTKYSSLRLFERLPLESDPLPLTKLTLRSWELSDDDPKSIRHLSALKSLNLYNCSLPRGKFWTALRSLGTTLVDLTIDYVAVDEALVDYLTSYGGLQCLVLEYSIPPGLVDKLFVALCTKHADSFRSLTVRGNEELHISTYAHHLAGLHSLTGLEISVTKEEFDEGAIDNTMGALLSASQKLCHLEEIRINGLGTLQRSKRKLRSRTKASLMRLQSHWPHRPSRPLVIRVGRFWNLRLTLFTTLESYIKF